MPRAKKTVTPTAPWTRYVEYVKSHRNQTIATGVTVLALLILAFPLRILIVPALVNGQPIFSWDYIKALHRQSGKEVLDQIINEKLIEQEIKKQGIQITQAEIDQEITQISDQIGSESGGLDALLAFQGVNRDEFNRQVRLNLAMEKLVKSTIQITDEQIKQELADNKSTYKDLSPADAATTAASNLRNEQLRQSFNTWFESLRSSAKIQNFFVTPPVTLPMP